MFRMGSEEAAAVARVLESKQLFRVNNCYKEVLNFERELAEKMGSQNVLALTSGTAALTSALTAAGIGPGDEVIVPGYTFIATPIAVLNTGAIPVMCEVDGTLTADPADIRKKITPRTKCIVPVHMGGMPCDMKSIMEIAKENDLFVIEDACQAVGAKFGGRYVGTIGHAGAYSFNYYKIISAGEGGAVITDDELLFERALIYHDVGSPFWSYEREIAQEHFVGQQYRSNEVTAAILRVQLTRLDGILKDLRRIKKTVISELDGCCGIRFVGSNDVEGDAALNLPFMFDSADKALAFAKADGVGGYRPYDSARHVFINWSPILSRRGAYNDKMNPYLMPANMDCLNNITPDSGPQTLDVLGRSVIVPNNPDMSDEQVSNFIASCKKAAASL